MRLIIAISLLLLTSATIAGGPDYEAQLNHQLPRLSSALSDLIKENKKLVINFVYVTNMKVNAEELLSYNQGHGSIEKLGKDGYKVKLRHHVNTTSINPSQWIRNNYFIGIAHHCDMDGLEVVESNAL